MYLTPWNQELNCFGSVYDSSGLIITSSLRRSGKAVYRPRDPVYLDAHSMRVARELEGDYIFLGHVFRSYGHFLLETLPMLSAPIINPTANAIFLPWGEKALQGDLLGRFLDLLNIDKKRILVHSDQDTIRGKFDIYPRPLAINDSSSLDPGPYTNVLSAIKSKIAASPDPAHSEPLFLCRKSSRTCSTHKEVVESFAQSIGFKLLKPEDLSLREQIQVMASSPVIAGFSGSQLHNSIFSSPATTIIEIGDSKYPLKHNPNQIICNTISGAVLKHVPYSNSPALICQELEVQLKSIM